jgi:hypothetical protein
MDLSCIFFYDGNMPTKCVINLSLHNCFIDYVCIYIYILYIAMNLVFAK